MDGRGPPARAPLGTRGNPPDARTSPCCHAEAVRRPEHHPLSLDLVPRRVGRVTEDPLLLAGRQQLEALFAELADELERVGTGLVIYMVGGSWLLWFDERAATRDVDSVGPVPKAAAEAIARVATRHDLSATWINGNAASFKPAGFDPDGCEVAFQQASLTVRLPPPETVFVMKLLRADPQDRDDMVRLWPRCRLRLSRCCSRRLLRGVPPSRRRRVPRGLRHEGHRPSGRGHRPGLRRCPRRVRPVTRWAGLALERPSRRRPCLRRERGPRG